jgi:putative ABC transport system permease protein
MPLAFLSLLLACAASAADEPAGILVSRQLLQDRGLAVGDVVRLSADPGGARARSFRILGSYEPLADPMLLTAGRLEARLHLPDLLALTTDPRDPQAGEAVRSIHVALHEPADAAELAREVRARVPGLVVTPAGGGERSSTFVVIDRFHLAIALVTVAAATAFLLALMVMRADERRETVGTLRLIGFSKRRVLAEVFLEGSLIAVAGALFGVLLATLLQGAFNRFFQWYYDTTLVFMRVSPALALRCVALAVPLGVLAGLVSSWHLLRRDVLALLRR